MSDRSLWVWDSCADNDVRSPQRESVFEKDGSPALNGRHEQIQKKCFTKWINVYLREAGYSVKDLFQDLRDGIKLLKLLEILSKENLRRPNMGKTRVEKMEIINYSLTFLQSKVHLQSIRAEDILNGNPTLTLELIWTIILRFHIGGIKARVSSNYIIFARDALLLWCQRNTRGYAGVTIADFSTSWRNGLAFLALIHAHRPDVVDFSSLLPHNHIYNLNTAFQIAEALFNIFWILDPQDVDVNTPDDKSIMTYVAFFYHKFKVTTFQDGGSSKPHTVDPNHHNITLGPQKPHSRPPAHVSDPAFNTHRANPIPSSSPAVSRYPSEPIQAQPYRGAQPTNSQECKDLVTNLLRSVSTAIQLLNQRQFPDSLQLIGRMLQNIISCRSITLPARVSLQVPIHSVYLTINTIVKKLDSLPDELVRRKHGAEIETAIKALHSAEDARELALMEKVLEITCFEELALKNEPDSKVRLLHLRDITSRILEDPANINPSKLTRMGPEGAHRKLEQAPRLVPTPEPKTRPRHGLVLVINNKFDRPPNTLPGYVKREEYVKWFRKGADQDTVLMIERFEALSGNRVSVVENVQNLDYLTHHLDVFKDRIRSVKPDYIVVIVSTHGGDRMNLLIDSLKPVDLYKDIVYQFDSKHFPRSDIPKIFLIQACQAGELTSLISDGPRGSSNSFQESIQFKPSKSQIFVGNATVPHEPAYRDGNRGSLYIQAIHKHFCKGKTLESMLREVDADVRRYAGRDGIDQVTFISKVPDFPLEFCF